MTSDCRRRVGEISQISEKPIVHTKVEKQEKFRDNGLITDITDLTYRRRRSKYTKGEQNQQPVPARAPSAAGFRASTLIELTHGRGAL
jgi:hypothetical protein